MKRSACFLIAVILLVCSSKKLFSQNEAVLYSKNCAQCHGVNMAGGNAGSLVDGIWQYGDADGYIFRNIKFGITHLGMPSYQASLNDSEIRGLVKYIRKGETDSGARKPAIPAELETREYHMKVEVFAEGLETPWAIDFIDSETALITERPGRLRMVQNGNLLSEPIKNTPKVLNEGQGGLLDVAIDPNYQENGWIYLAYSHELECDISSNRPGAMTRIVRGKIIDNSWTAEEVLFEPPHDTYRTTRHHYGCRIVFDSKEHLFFAIGDRGRSTEAQELSLPNGKVHRIFRDGKIPTNNPFIKVPKAISTIYSYGNRNIQGMAVHPETDELWTTEHGPMGGDELNLIQAGKNYGWPTITYGKNYNGTIITEFTHKQGMEQPNLHWTPSIAVCGLDFYRGDLFQKWKNKLLVGALKYEEVRLLSIEKDRVIHQEVILKGLGRVRDVSTGSDGAIYVVLNKPGKVLRLTPK